MVGGRIPVLAMVYRSGGEERFRTAENEVGPGTVQDEPCP